MPQIQENYVLQSGEGLSIFFVIIWLLGDLANVSTLPLFRWKVSNAHRVGRKSFSDPSGKASCLQWFVMLLYPP